MVIGYSCHRKQIKHPNHFFSIVEPQTSANPRNLHPYSSVLKSPGYPPCSLTHTHGPWALYVGLGTSALGAVQAETPCFTHPYINHQPTPHPALISSLFTSEESRHTIPPSVIPILPAIHSSWDSAPPALQGAGSFLRSKLKCHLLEHPFLTQHQKKFSCVFSASFLFAFFTGFTINYHYLFAWLLGVFFFILIFLIWGLPSSHSSGIAFVLFPPISSAPTLCLINGRHLINTCQIN